MQYTFDFSATKCKPTMILNEVVMSYKKTTDLSSSMFSMVNSSLKTAKVLREIWNEEFAIRESFYILCYDHSLSIVGYKKIADGGLDAVLVDIRLLMTTALLCRATAIVVAHNHPSGTLCPSKADRNLTSKIQEACNLLDIVLNDHIILTEEDYYSFYDSGDL